MRREKKTTDVVGRVFGGKHDSPSHLYIVPASGAESRPVRLIAAVPAAPLFSGVDGLTERKTTHNI